MAFALHNLVFFPPLLQATLKVVSSGAVWTQLLTALVVGLLTAFAFQFLVTNLGIAIGISVLGVRSATHDRTSDASSDDSQNAATRYLNIVAGLGILFTVNLVLFAACFLAAKFSQVSSPISGAITGIVIWSAYFLLLLWVSSTAVTSLVGSVLGATTGGFRRLVSTIANALSDSEDDTVTQEQMIAAIREEMQMALDAVNLRQQVEEQMQSILQAQALSLQAAPPISNEASPLSYSIELKQELQSYLQNTPASSLTPKRVDRKLKKLLEQAQTLNGNGSEGFDRATVTQWLNQREDLTDKKQKRILNQIQETWEQHFQEQLLESEIIDAETSDPADENQSGIAQTLSQVATLLSNSASGDTLKQTLSSLPKLLQQLQTTVPNWTEVAPVVLPAVLTRINDAIESSNPSDLSNSNADNSATDLTLKQTLKQLSGYSQLGRVGLNHVLAKPIEHLQEQSQQQIESIQQAAQSRIEQVKQQAQQRMESTRKAAATAAWWLFLTASTGAISAALAGMLASTPLR